MLDDLRGNANDDFEEDEVIEVDESEMMTSGGGQFLGMTAVQRMILAVLLFMLITVIGVLLLVATGRLG